MATSNFIDQIPEYFEGSLSPADRQAFEEALEENVALKEAVAIWEDMEEVLAPAAEDQLVANIARLRAESRAVPPMRPWFWMLAVPIVLLIGALSWYFWPEDEAPSPVIETTLPSEEIDSLEAPTDTLKIAPDDSLPTEFVAPPAAPDPPFRRPVTPPEKEEEAPQLPVFAANYDPNPLIEAEMTDQLRGGEVSIELIVPGAEATLVATNDLISMVFSGDVTTGLSQDELTIRLLLLSNRVEDYQQSNYLAILPAELIPTENGYTLSISGTATAQPGLYYYFLEWEEEETYLKIGKLRVE